LNLKRVLFIAFLFCCLPILIQAQNGPYYDLGISDDVRLGGSLNEELTDIITTAQGGYLVSGISHSSSWESYITMNYGFEDIWLVGLDEDLNIGASVTHGTAGNERVFNMIQTSDGGFAMCGYIQGGAPPHIFNGTETLELNGDFDLLLMKVDALGELLWVKNYGGSENDRGLDLLELQNGDLLVTGLTESIDGDVAVNNGKEDLWLLRTSSDGELLWETTFGGSNDDEGISMILKNNDAEENKDVWIVGASKSDDGDVSQNFGSLDIWLTSIDIETATLNWEKSYGGSSGDSGRKIVSFNEGAVICGQSASPAGFGETLGADDVVLLAVDSSGEEMWSTNIGGSSTDLLTDMVSPGFYIEGDIATDWVVYLAGYSFSKDEDFEPLEVNYTQENAWVIAYDLEQEKIRNMALLGGNDEDQFIALTRKPNEDAVVCAGLTRSLDGDLFKHGAHDGWVVEIVNGNSTGIEEDVTLTFDLRLSPNPVSDILVLETSLEAYAYSLYDLSGSVRFQSQDQQGLFGTCQIDMSLLQSGIYLLEVCDNNNCLRSKVVKQ